MVNVALFRFQQCLVLLGCGLLKGPLKEDFLEIFLTRFFGVCNFGKTSPIKVIFFLKMFKI